MNKRVERGNQWREERIVKHMLSCDALGGDEEREERELIA